MISVLPTNAFGDNILNGIKDRSDRPKVSVIIPVYNVEKYLKECMDSVINQTLKDIEIICVDDGSPDSCGAILDEYAQKDNRITVIHQKNKGLPMVRGAGLSIATGEYIKHVDSDDILDLKACEVCYQKAKEVNADILVHGSYGFNSSKRWILNQLNDEIIKKQTFNLISIFCWNHFYKNDLMQKCNIKSNCIASMAEDQALNMVCYPKAKVIKTIPDILYSYRVDNVTSLWHSTPNIKKIKDHCINIKFVYDNWKENNYFNSKEVRIQFLKWAIGLMCWPNDYECGKIFMDTVSDMDKTLFTDDIFNSLTKREKAKLRKIKNIVARHNR